MGKHLSICLKQKKLFSVQDLCPWCGKLIKYEEEED